MTGSAPRTPPGAAPLTGAAAPCWVNLLTRDLAAAQRFYGSALGWTFHPSKLGPEYSVARRDGTPLAGLGGVSSSYQTAVAWLPYFSVRDADLAAGRVRERSGTVAVGPLTLGTGRGVLASDRDGAVFGLWERLTPPAPSASTADRSYAWLRLRTRDAFDAAIFYGEVLDWASGRPGSCEVSYEQEEVIVRCEGRPLARISSGAVEAAPDPVLRPHWQVQFLVEDVAETAEAVRRSGGSVVAHHDVRGGIEAVVRDPDGALFGVTDAISPEAAGT
ncbi:VOC family protein [Streptomyces sp. NBC_01218]|uniref:VOC family protein n=1 Tax=unclassified Streptomyces TaxID=2593676 RepID=UPI0023B89E0D|nr:MULTISPECIES: VOC family protein [unclassified Streptomyces]WEH43357.1 VOC family protein [Streptomyces sp. AM 2-1-1]WSQ54990.1 VOC family protein [Streptomyces sp. NBC_01218]